MATICCSYFTFYVFTYTCLSAFVSVCMCVCLSFTVVGCSGLCASCDVMSFLCLHHRDVSTQNKQEQNNYNEEERNNENNEKNGDRNNDNDDEIINDVPLILDLSNEHDDIHANQSRKKEDIFQMFNDLPMGRQVPVKSDVA